MIYIQTAIITLCFFSVWFVICVWQKNYGLVDVAWGLGMSVIGIFLLLVYKPNLQITISIGLIVIWGLRLSIYLGKRNWGKPEDYRYVNMRKRWGNSFPLIKAFINVFLLQGILQYIMMFSSILSVANNNPKILYIPGIVGVIIALIGLFFESIGDYQLKKFKEESTNKGKLMTQGLWSITRHPNYFGEVIFWWGVYIASYQGINSIIGIISPLLITILINYVSGIPLLERKYSIREDYIEYAKVTPRLIPWFGNKEIRK